MASIWTEGTLPLFLDDFVEIRRLRPSSVSGNSAETTSGTYACLIFPGVSSDPLSGIAEDTNGIKMSCYIPVQGPGGWNDDQPPRIGDIVVYNDHEYSLQTCNRMSNDFYELEIRG